MLNNPLKRDKLAKAQPFDLRARRCPVRTQVCLALVCVPLLVLAACGSTTVANPSPTATQSANPSPTTTQPANPSPTAAQPTQTPVFGFITYTSPDHKYSIVYPPGWQEQTADGNPGRVSFTGSNNQEFEVNDSAGTPGGDLAQLATDYCNAIGQSTNHVIGTIVELGGQSWFKGPCSADAQPATVLIIEVTVYKGAVYQIDYSSPGASFNADDTTFYEPMQQNFQFLT